MRRRRSRTVVQVLSRLAGRVRVVEDRRERRLVVGGDILSVLPLDGDWSRLADEYWGHALQLVPLPARPACLFVGLGGGTQLHLLCRRTRPRALVVIEHDPVILRVARAWFGLDALGGVEFLCASAERAVPWLVRARRRFDFVMEDAAYAAEPERGRALVLSLVPLVAPGGALVVNRHRRGDARALAALLRPRFRRVRVRRVRRGGENVLVAAVGPRPGAARPAPAQPTRSRL